MKNKALALILTAVILASMIIPASVFASDAPSDTAVFAVSDCTILEGTKTADFTLTLENNPGIFAIVGYIGYPQTVSLAAFEYGPVYPESEYIFGNPMDNELIRDLVAADNRRMVKLYEEYGVSADGVLITTLYAENSNINVNNTGNGLIASFSLDTSALTDGEYPITFYIQKNGLCNVDLEDVDFELIQGTLTVLGCSHETEKIKTVDPDCLNEGYTEHYCSVCDRTYIRNVIPPLGHVDNEGVVTEPTCTSKGYTTYTCTICGEVYKKNEKYAIPHDFLDEAYREPTCTEDGINVTVCSTCGLELSYTDEGSALGHDLKKEIVREPTLFEKGIERTYCAKCDHEEFKDIPKVIGSDLPASPPPENHPQNDSFNSNLSYGENTGAPAIKDESVELPGEIEKEELKSDKNETSNKTENKTENKNYQTGDNITFLVILLAVSALGAGAVLLKRKKQNA